MSDPPPLDYEAPRSSPLGTTGLFVGHLVIWSILTPILVPLTMILGSAAGTSLFGDRATLAGAVLLTIAVLTAIVLSTRWIKGPRRASAACVGMLIGMGVGLLLFGACFIAFLTF